MRSSEARRSASDCEGSVTGPVGAPCLLVRVGAQLCALAIEHVDETMRPLPVRAVAGVPSFVRGVAVIRGMPVPVVDAASLLGQPEAASPARFVAVKALERRVALAVDEVVGVKRLDPEQLSRLPPLLAAASDQVVAAIGILDTELLMVLRSGKLVPDDARAALDAGAVR